MSLVMTTRGTKIFIFQRSIQVIIYYLLFFFLKKNNVLLRLELSLWRTRHRKTKEEIFIKTRIPLKPILTDEIDRLFNQRRWAFLLKRVG